MKKMQFIGIDDWDRPLYKDENGKLWKDVNLGNGTPCLHNSSDGTFDGEPDAPLQDEYEIVELGSAAEDDEDEEGDDE